MSYTPQTWGDGDPLKPVSAARLQHLDDGIAAIDAALANYALNSSLANYATTSAMNSALASYATTASLSNYALKTEVPALGEDCVTVPLTWPAEAVPYTRAVSGGPATPNCPIVSLPFGIQILSAEFMFDTGLTASATNYFTFNLLRVHSVDPTVIMASYSSDTVSIPTRKPWDPNPTYDPGYRLLGSDHALYVNCTRTGTPANALSYGLITVRYART